MKTSLLTIALALATMSLTFGQTPKPAAPVAPAANSAAKTDAKTTTKKHHKKASKKAVKPTGAAVTPSAKPAGVSK